MRNGIKRHGEVQKNMKRYDKSYVRSLDSILNKITGGERRLVFSEVPFGKSRVDIVVVVPGKKLVFVEFKTTSLKSKQSSHRKQIQKSFKNFTKFISTSPIEKKFQQTTRFKFYYLLTVERTDERRDDTEIVYEELDIPGMKYESLMSYLSAKHKT